MRQGARGPPQPYRLLTFSTRDIRDIVAERSKARGSGPRLARGVGSNPTDVILFSSGLVVVFLLLGLCLYRIIVFILLFFPP